MKKLILFFIFVISATFTFAERTIAVATFDITGKAVSKEEAESITELYITELVETGKLKIVDRTNFDKILHEMNFQDSDWSDAKKTVELGKVTNVSLIARGKIIKLGTKMYLSATVIDVKTANILSSAKQEFTSLDDIFSILSSFTNDIASGLIPKTGSTGPGGGTIYLVEGGFAYEVSPILGDFTWYSADSACKNYNAGNLSDWYLPSKYEVEQIYRNTNLIRGVYWTSSESSDSRYDTFQVYANGAQIWAWKTSSTCTVRAIRKWKYNED